MASLATPAQLAKRLKIPLAELDTAAAQQDLDDASGMVRAIGRQQFDFVAQETIELPGGDRYLQLPQRPAVVNAQHPLTVVEIGDFSGLDLLLVEQRDFVRTGNQLERGFPWYMPTRLQGWPWRRHLGVWAPRVRVTYSHGYTTIPDDVVAVVLDIAVQLYDNPEGVRSEQIDDYSVTYASEVLGAATVEGIQRKLGATGRRRSAHSI